MLTAWDPLRFSKRQFFKSALETAKTCELEKG